MHARNLVELGALAATHGAALIRAANRLPSAALQDYWMASKCRLDRWQRALRDYTDAVETLPTCEHSRLWTETRPTLEEILACETLTRVWTAVVCAFDKAKGQHDGEPIVRSVFIGHLEARHRALNIMVYGRGFEATEAVALNRLRRGVERWTDLLLGRLQCEHDASESAFDPERVVDFADDLKRQRAYGVDPWSVMMASLRTGFKTTLSNDKTSNETLNARIAQGVLGCFPPDMFDSTGAPKSLWMLSLADAPADTRGLVREMLALEDIAAPLRDDACRFGR